MENRLGTEMLQYMLENDMIDLSHIQGQIEMKNRKELLAKHPYAVWQGKKDARWYTYLPVDNGGRKLVKRSTQKKIEDLIVDYWKAQAEDPTIEDVFQEWNDWRLEMNKISASTHIRNQQIFNRHFAEFGKKRIKFVEVDDFVEFLEGQIPEHHLTAKAFANLKSVTGGIIKRAKRKKLIYYTADDVFHEIETSDRDFKKSVKDDSEEVFNVEETDKIIRYLVAHPDIWNLGLLILFATGLRSGELVALKWEDISSDAIFVRRTETRFKDENGKWRYEVKDFPKTEAGVRVVAVPQSYQWIFPAIRKLHDDEEYVFVRKGARMRTTCMRDRFRRVCKKLEIPNRSLHKIRKTYCSILFENGLDSKLITKQMGHTDIMCSEIHYHRNRKDLDETIKEISAIPDFQTKMTLIS